MRERARPAPILARVMSASSSAYWRPSSEMEQTTFLRSFSPSERSMRPRPARWLVRCVMVGRRAPWYSAMSEVFMGAPVKSRRHKMANSSKVRRPSEGTDCLTALYARLTDMNSLRSILLCL